MNCSNYVSYIMSGGIDNRIMQIYGADDIQCQRTRYIHIIEQYNDKFGNENIRLFSSPGRTEICGNHTDHNGGKVIAGALSVDMISAASKSDKITVISEGYDAVTVDVEDTEPNKDDYGKIEAIIKGILHFFKEKNYNIGGFNACVTSQVLKGSGMSSSASFEILICTILNELYNSSQISFREEAVISQKAENIYFGKPCGLMDQVACAAGGMVYIDFFNSKNPNIKKIQCSTFNDKYKLCVLDTGGNHADLTDDYSLVTQEMKLIAERLGCSRLADTGKQRLYQIIPELINSENNRAILRAIHFFDENERVDRLYNSLINEDENTALDILDESGHSSFEYLQNVYTPNDTVHQRISLALKLAQDFIKNKSKDGACRVHGGGFAGTTLNVIPYRYSEQFREYMERFFGKGSCHILGIRRAGGVCIE